MPADRRGEWVKGRRGDGTFRFNNSQENIDAGIAGKEVRFKDGHIAVGGFPPEAYYGGSADAAAVEIDKVTGAAADNIAADARMREKLKNPNWQRPKGYEWNHAGPPGSRVMELVDEVHHRAISHKGPAAEFRALRRSVSRTVRAGGRAGRATGRVMGALSVYTTVRDALQTLGVLYPGFVSAGDAEYPFDAPDGSKFIVIPAEGEQGATREFFSGPRKGQSEPITKEEEDQYRAQGEREWGKLIPGSIIKSPRFIPGTRRSTLPIYGEERGVRRRIGWVDEKGIHYFKEPMPAEA